MCRYIYSSKNIGILYIAWLVWYIFLYHKIARQAILKEKGVWTITHHLSLRLAWEETSAKKNAMIMMIATPSSMKKEEPIIVTCMVRRTQQK